MAPRLPAPGLRITARSAKRAYAITQVITAITALRLVADGLLELDAPANRYLRTVRLADSEVTVRDLLGHTAGSTTRRPCSAARPRT